MTDRPTTERPPTDPGHGTGDAGAPAQPPARRPGARRDPAAMRETLDAARRRLGPADPSDGPPQSAARQRALLREAVANQSVPLATGPVTAPATEDPAAPGHDTPGEAAAGGDAPGDDPDLDQDART